MIEINSKSTGDSYTANEFNNGSNTELQNVVADTNQTFSTPNQKQLIQGIGRIAACAFTYTDSGAANAYVLTPLNTQFTISTLTNGMIVGFNPTNTNTGASTVNVAGLGIRNIVDTTGAAINANDLKAGEFSLLLYSQSADNFTLLPLSGNAPSFAELAENSSSSEAGDNLVGYKGFDNGTSLSETVQLALDRYCIQAAIYNFDLGTSTLTISRSYNVDVANAILTDETSTATIELPFNTGITNDARLGAIVVGIPYNGSPDYDPPNIYNREISQTRVVMSHYKSGGNSNFSGAFMVWAATLAAVV